MSIRSLFAPLRAIFSAAFFTTALSGPALAAGVPVVISTTVDSTHNTLTVNGQNFGGNAIITLGSIKFTTVSTSTTQILGSFPAANPASSFSPGTYFLTLQFTNQQLAENNTAIVTLIMAYSVQAKTSAFTTEADKFRNYASAWRDRWNSVMELFMAGGNYAASGTPFPAGFPAAVDVEIASAK